MHIFKNPIGGELVETTEVMDVINPADESIAGHFYKCTEELANKALLSAKKAFEIYKKTTISERQELVGIYVKKLIENKKDIIKILRSESGKSSLAAEEDFAGLIEMFPYYIEEVKRRYSTTIPDYNGNYLTYLKYSPRGVAASFLAWNYPLHCFGLKVGQALTTGNTCVIKPAAETPLTAAYMGELFNQIEGFPKGTLNVVLGTGSELGKVLCGSKIPMILTLIGSTETGLKIIEDMSKEMRSSTPKASR